MKKFTALALTVLLFALSAPAWADGSLYIFSWAEYIDPDVIREFEAKHDVTVRLDYYESNEEMVAKLQSGGLGQYDIIMPSSYIIPSLEHLDLLEPLNHDLLPNIKNLEPEFTEMEVDPGNRLSIPYQWGTTGIAIRTENIEKIPHSWKLLYDPKETCGSFTILDTARDGLGSALKYLGYSLNTIDPKEIEEAIQLTVTTKKNPSFIAFDGGTASMNKLYSDITTVAHSYSGEALRVQELDPDVHYILPEEGAEIWTDLVAIPRKAKNLENAHAFINFLLEPEVGARQAAHNRCATPNAAAKAFIPEEDLNNPVMYPDLSKITNLEYIRDLESHNRLYDEAWMMIKTK